LGTVPLALRVDAFYCRPGIEGAHEKGGIEGEVGRFRRAHLSPMPVVDSLSQLNDRIRLWDFDDEDRRVNDRIRTVAQDFSLKRPLLGEVTAERFEPGLALTPRVNRSSPIRVRRASYFTAAHEAFWAAARKTEGDAGGTKALIDVLLLHRSMTSDDVVAGITAALTVGAVTADVVAVEARRHEALSGSSLGRPLVEHARGPERRVVSLTHRRLADPAAVIAGLPADTRPLPSVAAYDQLLRLPEQTAPVTEPTAKKGTAS
jgi:hypothetical protein